MRTTVDLPEELNADVLMGLVTKGLGQEKSVFQKDPISGLATISIGRPITAEETKRLIDEDACIESNQEASPLALMRAQGRTIPAMDAPWEQPPTRYRLPADLTVTEVVAVEREDRV
jgi:hypothetical protein